MKMNIRVLSLATIAILLLMMPALVLGGGEQSKHKGMKDSLYMLVKDGAVIEVKDLEKGAVFTVTGEDPTLVERIKQHGKMLLAKKEATGKEGMVVCPVMGSKIKPSQAAATREYKGKTYYLCCGECVTAFDQDPEKYATQ